MKFLVVVIVVICCSVSIVKGNNTNIGKPLNIKEWSRADKRIASILIDMYHDTRDAEHNFLLHFENSQQMFNEIKKENVVSSSDKGRHATTEKEDTENKENKENKDEKENIEENDAVSQNYMNSKEQKNELKHSSLLSVPSPTPSNIPRFIQLKAKGPVEEETIWRAIYDTQLRRSPPTANVFVFSEENIEKEFDLAKMDAYASELSKMKDQFEKNLNYMSKELSRQKQIKETLKTVLILEEEIQNMKQKKKIIRGGPIRKGNDATKTEC